MIRYLKLTEQQKKIVETCISENKEEFQRWHFQNVLFPMCILLATSIIVAIEKSSFELFLKTLFNGAITLLGITVLFSMSSYLFRIKMYAKDKMKAELNNLIQRFDNYKSVLILIGAFVYYYQISHVDDISYSLIILGIIMGTTLFFSIRLGARMFIIRDDLYAKAFNLNYEALVEESIENTNEASFQEFLKKI